MMDYYRSPEALVRLRRAGKREERGQQKENKERICPALGGLPAWALGPHPPHPDLHHCPGLPRPPAWGAGQYCEGRRCWGAARGSSVTFLGVEASLVTPVCQCKGWQRDASPLPILAPWLPRAAWMGPRRRRAGAPAPSSVSLLCTQRAGEKAVPGRGSKAFSPYFHPPPTSCPKSCP